MQIYGKDFDRWNEAKKIIHTNENLPLFSEREVWWCVLGLNVSSEEDGKGRQYLRPVLIIRKFNKNIFYGIPITSNKKEGIFYAPIDSGDVHGSVILSQMRLIDARRLSHILGKITGKESAVIKQKLKALFP